MSVEQSSVEFRVKDARDSDECHQCNEQSWRKSNAPHSVNSSRLLGQGARFRLSRSHVEEIALYYPDELVFNSKVSLMKMNTEALSFTSF